MEHVTLTSGLLNQVLSYLGTKPFIEVYQLINALQQEAVTNVKQAPVQEQE